MKRNIRIILFSVFAALAAVSCSQEQLGVIATSNADDDREIHFVQTSMTKEFAQGTKEGTVAVTLARHGNRGTYRVVLQKSGRNADLFALKDTVVIPDGQYSVEIPVKVDMSGVVLGSSVEASLAIVGRDAQLGDGSAYIGKYSDFLDLSVSFALEWEPYMRTTESGEEVQQKATYYFSQFYTGWQSGIPVEVATGTDNIFRLVDWANGAYFLFKVDWKNKTVVVPGQSMGYYYESSGSYVYVSDLAQYLGEDSLYSSYPCTWDGDRTFTLTLIYYVPDGGYFGYGEEKIVFAGDHDTDPVLKSVVYEGEGRFTFEFNDYVESCRAVVVSGDIASDSEKVDEIYRQICLGTAEGVRTFTETTQTWTPETAGAHTLVAVPYDAEGKPGAAVALRFTYDPEHALMPEFVECGLSVSEDDPYTTANWNLKVRNTSTVKYVMSSKDMLDLYEEYYGLDRVFEVLGKSLEAEYVEAANSEEGVSLHYAAAEGTEYRMVVRISNDLGDVVEKNVTVQMRSHADSYEAKTLDDFTGSYLMSATVTTSDDSTGSSEAFRVDIIKTGYNTVSIKGLSNYKTYSPEIAGTYIPEENCIRLESQNLGEFSYMTVVFGFVSNLYTGIWGSSSALEFGFGSDGYIHFRAREGSEFPVNGYKFLLFDGSAYSGYAAGDKTYTDLLMMKI